MVLPSPPFPLGVLPDSPPYQGNITEFMATVKEGDRVKIATRPVTNQDKELYKFYEHMQGLVGTVANRYSPEEVAVNIDPDCLVGAPKEIHSAVTKRMQKAFITDANENIKKLLTKEEQKFIPHYVLLVKESDLEKI